MRAWSGRYRTYDRRKSTTRDDASTKQVGRQGLADEQRGKEGGGEGGRGRDGEAGRGAACSEKGGHDIRPT